MLDPAKLTEMMQQAQRMQDDMMAELKKRTVEGTSGGGLVSVTFNGLYEPVSVRIDPAALKQADAELLADLVRAAIANAAQKVEEARAEHARGLAQGLGIPGMSL
jgi:nucleoid-associated protein EbfC